MGRPRVYLAPDKIDSKVLLGHYEDTESPIRAPTPLNYFDIGLAKGNVWCFEPPEGHSAHGYLSTKGASRLAVQISRTSLPCSIKPPLPARSNRLQIVEPSLGAGQDTTTP